MKKVNGKFWRNSASLIMLNKRNSEPLSVRRDSVNYDVLLQTRTGSGSFPNSVVFPGGVAEPADESSDWLHLLQSFGYSQNDFSKLHRADTLITPIFQPDPVKRHVSLRITAIRETFEELGVLICSKENKKNRSGLGADILSDIDVEYWQKKVSNNPEELLTLCQKYNCYPDIWSLYYWSNWLTPVFRPKRFDTAFFLTILANSTLKVISNSEVTHVQWANPEEILEKNLNNELLLYPPQTYELNRLLQFKDIYTLKKYAEERSCNGSDLMYPIKVQARDGTLQVLPGDDLYPSHINYKEDKILSADNTILHLRHSANCVHRLEVHSDQDTRFIFNNYNPTNHVNMGDIILPVKTAV